MALQKQSVPITFAQGLDQKTDPKQVPVGRFLRLRNSVFTKAGLLAKRNGYGRLAALPTADPSTFLTTFNGNLTAVSNTLNAYSSSSNSWVNKGAIQPAELSTLPLIRSNTNQSQADSAVASNGLVCTVFTDNITSGSGTVPSYKYVVADSVTGQNIVAPAVITPNAGTVAGAPKVFNLGSRFIIVFTNNISGTYSLRYISISTLNPGVPSAEVVLSSNYTPATTGAFDGAVANGSLYLAWNGADVGGAIRVSRLDSNLTIASPVVFANRVATHMSVAVDMTTPSAIVYVSFYDSAGSTAYTLAVNPSLVTVLAPTQTLATGTMSNITSAAQSGVCTVYFEVVAAYSYNAGIPTHYIQKKTVTQAGTVSSATVVCRSVGLASEAFIVDGTQYLLALYYSAYQPTYFLLSGDGKVVAKLAYSNGGSYLITGLPSVTVTNNIAQIAYLIKDLVQAVNKTLGVPNATGIYSQTGINLASFTIGTSHVATAEIGANLHLTGGIVWAYDGYAAVEQGFNVWPDNVEADTSATGGLLTAQQYYYVATYEWSDNQGNIFRSAPSLPVSITTSGTTSSNTIDVPTLRLTYKTANPVKIVIYRWSVAQQTFYQVTSIQAPLMNSTTTDSVSFVDTQADASILGNNILYTTGGVLENIAPPAAASAALFNNRLWLLLSENPNTLWYSKEVIQDVPVEMSDLLTRYIAPSTGAQGSTGPTKCLAPMDDKLILFKANAIYYISGAGPDITGANNQYSEAIGITATVGCSNQQSIVFTPAGLMFQSSKGIWLLGRDLSTTYIGSPVEDFTTNAVVQSAVNVPETNQVRFTLSSGVTIVYNYFYGQWGSFSGVPAISSTVYQSLHTYLNSFGQVFQETPGKYLDGSSPVLMSFTTSWLNLAGLQGYERAYFFYLLGTYLSPHKLSISIAYDYNPSPSQNTVITPDNFGGTWGSENVWGGGSTWGGASDVEQWRVFLDTQQCQAFQIALDEVFDPSYGTIAGAGLTLSGLNLQVGMKSGSPRIKPSRSAG